jgi:hypothetical protein
MLTVSMEAKDANKEINSPINILLAAEMPDRYLSTI